MMGTRCSPASKGPIGASWMTREAREREISDYVAYLDEVALWIRRELGCELAPTVLGFSQGVATALGIEGGG